MFEELIRQKRTKQMTCFIEEAIVELDKNISIVENVVPSIESEGKNILNREQFNTLDKLKYQLTLCRRRSEQVLTAMKEERYDEMQIYSRALTAVNADMQETFQQIQPYVNMIVALQKKRIITNIEKSVMGATDIRENIA